MVKTNKPADPGSDPFPDDNETLARLLARFDVEGQFAPDEFAPPVDVSLVDEYLADPDKLTDDERFYVERMTLRYRPWRVVLFERMRARRAAR